MDSRKNGRCPCRRSIATLTVLAAALLIAGCGGDTGESELSAASIQQLNAACAAQNDKAAAEILRLYDHPRVKRADSERRAINLEAELFMPILLGDARAQVQAIRNSASVSDDRRQLRPILAAYRKWIGRASRAPRGAVLANDVYNEARKLAGSRGLVDCGTSPFEIRTAPQ